jgi:hypothetical protein
VLYQLSYSRGRRAFSSNRRDRVNAFGTKIAGTGPERQKRLQIQPRTAFARAPDCVDRRVNARSSRRDSRYDRFDMRGHAARM